MLFLAFSIPHLTLTTKRFNVPLFSVPVSRIYLFISRPVVVAKSRLTLLDCAQRSPRAQSVLHFLWGAIHPSVHGPSRGAIMISYLSPCHPELLLHFICMRIKCVLIEIFARDKLDVLCRRWMAKTCYIAMAKTTLLLNLELGGNDYVPEKNILLISSNL